MAGVPSQAPLWTVEARDRQCSRRTPRHLKNSKFKLEPRMFNMKENKEDTDKERTDKKSLERGIKDMVDKKSLERGMKREELACMGKILKTGLVG